MIFAGDVTQIIFQPSMQSIVNICQSPKAKDWRNDSLRDAIYLSPSLINAFSGIKKKGTTAIIIGFPFKI